MKKINDWSFAIPFYGMYLLTQLSINDLNKYGIDAMLASATAVFSSLLGILIPGTIIGFILFS